MKKAKEPHIILAQDQSKTSSDGPSEILDKSTLNSIPFFEPTDLDIPIAIRKGTRTCTNHPISKCLSYKKTF